MINDNGKSMIQSRDITYTPKSLNIAKSPSESIQASIVDINSLHEHEEINKQYCEELTMRIKKDGIIKRAIAVDKNTMVVLDGHHRLNALKELGCQKIPIMLIDYTMSEIQVRSWNGIKVNKRDVLEAGLSNKKLPPKTSKHMVITNGRERHISVLERRLNVPLTNLKHNLKVNTTH
jgi:hypothetical protein